MDRRREERLLNPKVGSRIAAAQAFGIDLTILVENLRLTPSERIKANDSAINDLLKFEAAMKRAKKAAKLTKIT